MRLRILFCLLIVTAGARGAFGAEPAPEAVRLADYSRRVESELREHILPFWLEHTRDRHRGGFYGEIDDPLVVQKDAPRGALLTTRILWTFSAAYTRYRDPAYLEMAQWANADLLARFWDKNQGGLCWSVSADGKVLDPRKILYVQAFGIYGLSEFYRATGDKAALDRAIALYRAVERHARDRQHGGYLEEFSRDWTVSRGRGPGSAMSSQGQKSQNTHLHLLEAYTNLLRAWPDPQLRRDLRGIVDTMLAHLLDANHHLRLFTDEDWRPASEEISTGHDIEFSWLLVEAAEVLGDAKLLDAAKAEATAIARATLREGVDPDGGLLSEHGPDGVEKPFKEWWSQAEAAVGFLNAFQLSGDPELLAASRRSWAFIEANLVDRKNGEWFFGVSRDGRTKLPVKVSFWKCPYHNGRACLELVERLHRLQAEP